LHEEIERRRREGPHVGDPVGAAGLERDHPFARTGDRDAAVPGGIAVAVAGRPGGSGLGDAPGGGEPLARGACQQRRIDLGRGPHAGERRIRNIEQHAPRLAGIDHGAADEISRCARHRQQRRRYEPAGRRFGDRDGFLSRHQDGGKLFGHGDEFVHARHSG
jgi:hypothetical protein